MDYPHLNKFIKAIEEFRHYIEQNQSFIPNYGERWRNGERISTSFVESTVNVVINKRFNKKQQMQWTERGAHLLLQARSQVLNRELDAKFKQWYPGFKGEEVPDVKLAA